MLYNNPIAYRTDVTATQLAELADRHENLHAMKESSGDVRRVSAVRWGVAGNIVIAWILTMPAAALMAAIAYYLGRLIL